MFHNHPYKNSMQQRNIYFIEKFQSKSVNYKKEEYLNRIYGNSMTSPMISSNDIIRRPNQ
jgi:hypothetical protein